MAQVRSVAIEPMTGGGRGETDGETSWLRMGARARPASPVIRAETEIVREIAPVDGYVRISLIAREGGGGAQGWSWWSSRLAEVTRTAAAAADTDAVVVILPPHRRRGRKHPRYSPLVQVATAACPKSLAITAFRRTTTSGLGNAVGPTDEMVARSIQATADQSLPVNWSGGRCPPNMAGVG